MASKNLNWNKNGQKPTARTNKFRSPRIWNSCDQQRPKTPEQETCSCCSAKIRVCPVVKVLSREPEEIFMLPENCSKLPKTKVSYYQPKNSQRLREEDKKIKSEQRCRTKKFPKGSSEYHVLATALRRQLLNENTCGVSKSPSALPIISSKPISKFLGNCYNTKKGTLPLKSDAIGTTSHTHLEDLLEHMFKIDRYLGMPDFLCNDDLLHFSNEMHIEEEPKISNMYSVTRIKKEPKNKVCSARSIKELPKDPKLNICVRSTKEKPKVYTRASIQKESKNTKLFNLRSIKDEAISIKGYSVGSTKEQQKNSKICSVRSIKEEPKNIRVRSIKEEPIDTNVYSVTSAANVSRKTITKKRERNSSINRKLSYECDSTSVSSLELLYVRKPKKSYGSISTNTDISQTLFSVEHDSCSTSIVVKDVKCKPKLTYFRNAPVLKKELVRPCKSEFIYAPDALSITELPAVHDRLSLSTSKTNWHASNTSTLTYTLKTENKTLMPSPKQSTCAKNGPDHVSVSSLEINPLGLNASTSTYGFLKTKNVSESRCPNRATGTNNGSDHVSVSTLNSSNTSISALSFKAKHKFVMTRQNIPPWARNVPNRVNVSTLKGNQHDSKTSASTYRSYTTNRPALSFQYKTTCVKNGPSVAKLYNCEDGLSKSDLTSLQPKKNVQRVVKQKQSSKF